MQIHASVMTSDRQAVKESRVGVYKTDIFRSANGWEVSHAREGVIMMRPWLVNGSSGLEFTPALRKLGE